MLTRDTGKYIALVVGLSFATLLICQQGAIFLGLLKRSTGALQNIAQPDLWVCDPYLNFIEEVRPLSDRDWERVRAVPGVAWAEPFFSSRATVELPDGKYKTAQMVGIDRSTMVGQPPVVTAGSLDDLRAPDAVMVDESSREKLANCQIGDTFRLNDKRAVVVGFCQVKLGFESNALIYTTYDNALRFTPVGRERITFVFVKVQEGRDVADVAREIRERTGLAALTRGELALRTINFILRETGIGINFGITVLLGFVVGLAVTAAIFYQFTLENLRHFAVLKALGARNRKLISMVLLQAMTVGVIGFGIGTGLTGIFTLTGRRPGAELAPYFPWQLLVVCAGGMFVCIMMGSLLSIRRVVTLEPGVVFK
ncbi:MAG: ABC transporter permease [Planctomycetota bacterium]|nr:ABC transporter permease [Planctomycetota bacterium]